MQNWIGNRKRKVENTTQEGAEHDAPIPKRQNFHGYHELMKTQKGHKGMVNLFRFQF